MRKIIIVLALSLSLGGCATFQTFQKVQEVANATVPASIVIPAANTFNIVKAGATRYGQYCIQEKMTPAICSKATRRIVIKAVRAGTSARDQMADSLANGTPASASIYNLMVGAISNLQNSPAAASQFTGVPLQ